MPNTNGRPPTWRLSHDPWGRLVFTDSAGTRHDAVEPVRAFPLGDPEHWISILDASGHELAVVESVDSLPADTRSVLQDELSRREFLPVVTRIVRIKGEVPNSRWTVDTDRGKAEFTVVEDDNVRKLGAGKILVIDDRGMRYLIPNIDQLDLASRRALEAFV